MSEFLKNQYKNLIETQSIDPTDYQKYQVKRGLRYDNGTGVLVGLTKVSDVSGYHIENDVKIAKEGNLYYRGIDIKDVVEMSNEQFGYENTCFLLLFGHYPNEEESKEFNHIIRNEYELPEGFVENIILKSPSKSLMNHITRCILSLYSYDDNPDDLDSYNLIKKGISIIAKMPSIISYSLQAKNHYLDKGDLHIHHPKIEYSFAENILYLSRSDGRFSFEEAKILDKTLSVHADHGGGNNSAFVGTVASSTITDLYSMICASMISLKGPRHGGANMAVLDMMNQIIADIGYDATNEDIENIIDKIFAKQYFDNTGLIYGIGHAIYTLSDPRCSILKEEAYKLSLLKNNEKFDFYNRFEKIAISKLEKKKDMKCCANVDFYSGLIYEMLDIPRDLFIPVFASARLVGWIAHDIENLLYCNKIIRPATKYVGEILGGDKND
jgi:citrate synthase